MRIKLSYTVDEEDVLGEVAKLIGLSGDDLQQAITLFTSTQNELNGHGATDASFVPNVEKTREMIEEFRKALLAVDTRLSEGMEILEGFERYRASQRNPAPPLVSEYPPVAAGPAEVPPPDAHSFGDEE